MDLDNYREKYNQDFHSNTEKKIVYVNHQEIKNFLILMDTYLKQSCYL